MEQTGPGLPCICGTGPHAASVPVRLELGPGVTGGAVARLGRSKAFVG